MTTRHRIPYTSGIFREKLRGWNHHAGIYGYTFTTTLKPGNWKVDRLFHCGQCNQHAMITGRKKALCPGCHKQMTLEATHVVPHERQVS